jgi:hypothetical protein
MPKFSQGTFALAGLAAFALWLFVALPFLYGPPPRFAETSSLSHGQSEPVQYQVTGKPDGTANAPFFIRIPKTAKEEAEEVRERQEKLSTDRFLMIFTGAVALFTLLLVGATILLYRAGEKQLKLASAIAERRFGEMRHSIEVAQDAVKAAHKSADAAERRVVEADRAWIEVTIDLKGDLVFEKDMIHLCARAGFKNVGKSPAVKLSFTLNMFNDVGEAADKAADYARRARDDVVPTMGYGQVLYPDSNAFIEEKMHISRASFLARIEAVNEASPTDQLHREKFTKNFPAVMAFARYALPRAGSLDAYRYSTAVYQVCQVGKEFDGFDGSIGTFTVELVDTYYSGEFS